MAQMSYRQILPKLTLNKKKKEKKCTETNRPTPTEQIACINEK